MKGTVGLPCGPRDAGSAWGHWGAVVVHVALLCLLVAYAHLVMLGLVFPPLLDDPVLWRHAPRQPVAVGIIQVAVVLHAPGPALLSCFALLGLAVFDHVVMRALGRRFSPRVVCGYAVGVTVVLAAAPVLSAGLIATQNRVCWQWCLEQQAHNRAAGSAEPGPAAPTESPPSAAPPGAP